jgi:hypothetical protein
VTRCEFSSWIHWEIVGKKFMRDKKFLNNCIFLGLTQAELS